MTTFLLPSREMVDLENVIESLIDVGWGVKGLKAIVAFGSAARPLRIEQTLRESHFLGIWFLPYQYVESRAIRPNDIDILAVYDSKDVKKEQPVVPHTAVYDEKRHGYDGVYFRKGVKRNKLHLLHVTTDKLDEAISSKDEQFYRIRKDALVLQGSIEYFPKRLSPSSWYWYDQV